MKRVLPFVITAWAAVGCGADGRSLSGPSSPVTSSPPAPSPPAEDIVAVYSATLTASAGCAPALAPEVRERTYTATLHAEGRLEWSSATVKFPPGHSLMSSATLSKDMLSFSVDRERDPFDDDFHGIWEEFGNGSFLTISARGAGKVEVGEVTGTFEGQFTSRELTDPRQLGSSYVDRYCSAKDHRFRFVRQ